MDYKINVNFDRFEEQLKVVDAHTMGEFCRILVGGIPEPQGNTMIEKKVAGGELRLHPYSTDVRAARTS